MNLQHVLDAFDSIHDPVVTPVATGLIHETYGVLDASGRNFILQRVNPVFSRGVLENIQDITRHLREHGITTFELVPSHGRPYADLGDDGLWRLMTRLPGVSIDSVESAEQLHAAGRLVATFHRGLFDYTHPLKPIGFPFHDTPRHLEDLRIALRECEEHVCHARVLELATRLFDAAESLPDLPGTPKRVIHGDLKLNNLLFDSTGSDALPRPIALIDLDTVARLPLAYDWGDALRSWCNRLPEDSPVAELDLDFAHATADGLMSAFDRAPDAPERESLHFALELVSLELSVRFATDALRETHWSWDASRFERAGEHNLCRARGQFDLYRQARATHRTRALHITPH